MKNLETGRRAVAQWVSLSVLATSFGLSVPLTASAQGALEEVIVTARKREESLQEIPVAVSALSGNALEEAGLRDLADLGKVIPNVDVGKGNGTSGAANVYIRGVGARNTGVNFDSGVGIYLDGIYMSRPDGAILDNVDIQSVQVLRGPQGTLFGKNTTGGAILYSTNRPNEEFEGNAEVRVGNYGRLDGKVTVNVPLADDLAYSRLSLFSVKRDGYVENVVNGKNYNDEERLGGQLQFRFLAGESVVVDVNTNYSKTNQYGRGQGCQNVTGIPGAGWQAQFLNNLFIIPSTGQSVAAHCADVEDLDDNYKVIGDLDEFKYEVETKGASVTVDWDINDTMSFKSITGWRNTVAAQGDELDGIGIPFLARTNFGNDITEPRNTEQYSQEFQLTGTAANDTLSYVVGLFGFQEKSTAGTTHNFNTGPYIDNFSLMYVTTATELLTDNSAVAAYTQVDWAFADSWNLTLGLRYTKEDRELTRIQLDPDPDTLTLDGGAVFVGGIQGNFFTLGGWENNLNLNHDWVASPLAYNNQTRSVSNSNWNPMASIQYLFEGGNSFIDGGTAYFTVATGFLSGGLSENLAVDPIIVNGQPYFELGEYDPEKVINYEIGVKMDAFDSSLRLNTAFFYTDYTDRQLTSITVDPAGNIAPQTINAAKSSIMGLEVETLWIPIPNFDITFNFAFSRGEIKEYDDVRLVVPGSVPGCEAGGSAFAPDKCFVDRSDEDLPRLPTQSYFLAFQYNWETSIGSFIPRLQASYRKNVEGCFDRSSCVSGIYKQNQYDLSARMTWLSPEQHWRMSLYGTNLTGYQYIASGTPLIDLMNTASTIYNTPKTYGLELAYNW